MEKMKYKISSRATMLIGREGVSRADGAIIELIKNTYDADADFCYIAFDIEHDKIYILDNGVGMTKDIVESAWMLIGTNNKQKNFLSDSKRVRSGEKGIGRFALDRLGSKCTMYTKSQSEKLIYWFNDWNKFEETGKTLDEIEADFDYIEGKYKSIIPPIILNNIISLANKKNSDKNKNDTKSKFSLETGTLFIISGLRDEWNIAEINKIYSVLGFLIPPSEQSEYFLFAQKSLGQNVDEIECEAIDDFDYKVSAEFDGENVEIVLDRNEFDLNIMPKDIFDCDAFKKEPYTLENFINRKYTINKSLGELVGNTNLDFLKKAKKVGPFNFQYLFMKLSGGEGSYFYKPTNTKRRMWMDEHGGIKIYRDNFVVRPYGDANSKSYDWLGLDARKGGNPVAISHKSGAWHVNNAQIQGTVLISRINNDCILDKSSREGIIENEFFEILSKILTAIISIFEKDRAYIVYNIKKYLDEKNQNEQTKAQASEIAKDVLKKNKKDSTYSQDSQDTKKLAEAVKIFEGEREELISEIKLLRALATNGLMTTSMVHDLKTINSLLVTRVYGFKCAVRDNDQELINRNFNDLKLNDEFLKSWITVITNQSNRDRRKRMKKDMGKTIEASIKLLSPILQRKKVNIEFHTDGNEAKRKIFETDFDSIIYNLIINSIESFESSECISRQITIKTETKNSFIVHYSDNGHGLSSAFKTNPYSIFDYGTTSKFDSSGNQIGTGLGMYIVASSINEYNGAYTITKTENGFGVDISIPLN